MGTPPRQGSNADKPESGYTQSQQRYPVAPPTPPSRLTPERKRGRGLSLVLLLLMLLFGVGVYMLLGGRFGSLGATDNGPAEATTRFYSSLSEGKCEDALATLAKPEMTDQELCDTWKGASAGTTSKGAVENVSIEGDTAIVKWTMTLGDKPHKPTVSLRKADNIWKITSPVSELVPTR